MIGNKLREIKRAQKETHLLREISNLVSKVSLDEQSLQGIYVSRVKLSPDKSRCYVYFACSTGKEDFHKKLGTLILYKPSLRSALAKILDNRYTPDLVFEFDTTTEKQQRFEELLSKITHTESDHVEDEE